MKLDVKINKYAHLATTEYMAIKTTEFSRLDRGLMKRGVLTVVGHRLELHRLYVKDN
jgi:hypothetical protein